MPPCGKRQSFFFFFFFFYGGSGGSDSSPTHNSAAAFRMILTPIDTFKTTMQAQGSRGTALLRKRVKENGVGSLWWGAFATAAATFVGHYPWFATVSPC